MAAECFLKPWRSINEKHGVFNVVFLAKLAKEEF